MSNVCLSLLCTESSRERMTEALLQIPELEFFVSTSASGHGLNHEQLNAREKVLGMASMTCVQALLRDADQKRVMTQLSQKLANTGVRYWVVPVLEQGAFT